MSLPIRWRLTLFIALVIGAILIVLGLALYLLSRSTLLAEIEDTTQGRAASVARAVESGEKLSDDDLQRLTVDGVCVIVRDGNGGVLRKINLPEKGRADDTVWRRALSSGKSASGTARLLGDNPYYIHAVPVAPSNGPARVVEAAKPYEPTLEVLESFEVLLGAGIAAALLLSIGGAYLLAVAALRPVDTVTSVAREMSESDLSKRLPVANSGDEIGRLATTINGLFSRLETAFADREETLERQRRFAADASHELRTPLTAISGHARMLDEWALEADPERAKRSVGAIRREAGRMRNLIESLLILTRGDEGDGLEVGRHDFGEVAEEAIHTARAAAADKVTVEYFPPERKVEAVFDRDRIRQAALILVDNAIRYTPEGGSVRVRVGEENGQVALAVSDTGVGVPEEQLPLIFERFYRVEESRTGQGPSAGGAGLGLSIARQVAEAHGGTIEVESKPDAGSTFTLLLPRAPHGREG
ncbi:MAG TPA: HAMP domain-containing sensor histidine kinase [Rubrobacteraceae bacterium]|nr:HAMP domain-containing sensor histidine kinase [Rubrobacteraceae bacterium]